jgi:Flp pilus assembly protein TadD
MRNVDRVQPGSGLTAIATRAARTAAIPEDVMAGRVIMMFFLLLGSASAQFNAGSPTMTGRVRVRVSFADQASCDPTTQVTLTEYQGATFAENSVNGQCTAEFFDVPAGNYRVAVVGGDVANSDKVDVALSPGMTEQVEVRARHASSPGVQEFASAAFVTVGELGVPSNARKEFEKAKRLITKQDWAKAKERLSTAIAIYPRYAAAYNNLGAVYSFMGDTEQACEALQKAADLDDHMALAYLNLGRVSFATKDFPAAEKFLSRALSLGPPDTGELMLLAYAQLADRHFEEVIATSRQAHRSQLKHHAYLHVVAAKAQATQGRNDDSIEELKQFLTEEPTGRRADKIRNTLTAFRAEGQAQ